MLMRSAEHAHSIPRPALVSAAKDPARPLRPSGEQAARQDVALDVSTPRVAQQLVSGTTSEHIFRFLVEGRFATES